MRDQFTTAVELLGAVLIVAGVALVSIPAAFVAAGVLAIAGSWLVSR